MAAAQCFVREERKRLRNTAHRLTTSHHAKPRRIELNRAQQVAFLMAHVVVAPRHRAKAMRVQAKRELVQTLLALRLVVMALQLVRNAQ